MTPQFYELLYGKASINHQLFMYLNHATNPVLDALMPIFTLLGGSRISYYYFLILFICALVNKEWVPWRVLLVYCIATFVALGAEELLKGLLHVPRPALAIGIEQIHILGEVKLKNSLPSGHAVFSFMTAFTLGYGRGLSWKLPLFIFALLVGYSRIYMGAHYPLDVLAGALVGMGGGFVVWKLYELVEGRWQGRKEATPADDPNIIERK